MFHKDPFPAVPPATREVHSQIRQLNLKTYPPSGTPVIVTVAAAPAISIGEVESQSPSGNPANDFPARSFFDMYVHITLPACGSGGFTGATLYNRPNQPLVVKNDTVTSLPPGDVYEHDASSEVPLLFAAPGKHGKRDEFFGCVILAGHLVGPEGTPVARAQREPARESVQQREKFEKQKEAFERHMQEAERHMSRECKGR
jgi:hypothetical protein